MSKNNAPSVYAEISRIYHDPAASSLVPPLAKIDFLFDNGSMATAFLPSDQLTTSGLKKAVPRLRGLPDIRPLVCELTTQFADIMDGTVSNFETFSGLLLPRTGLQRLPDGHSLYVLGDQLIGPITTPVLPRPPVSYHMMLSPIQQPLAALFSELVYCSSVVVAPIIFLFATLLRSWINEITPSWQAVLAITGGQGLGKTTLARKITDWICDSQNKPALLYSAGSTPAAIHDTMVTARDLPLVIDDLCLSASPKLQQKYRDLGAQFVREGTNASGISKKAGNQTMSFSCNAGIILTAEFALENPSDITRCIFIPLTQPPVVASSLTPELIGAACRRFIEWFLQHESEAAENFRKINSEEKPDDMHPRVFHNFLILRTVFSLALRAAREDGLSASSAEPITARYETGIEQSQQYQKKLLDDLDRSKKKGNLAFVLLECYGDPKVFNLTKNIKKLDKRDGIEWKNDLCLRPAALERAVRLQDGYQNYTLSKIARELKDMGALVIQEEGTLQVRLKKDTPRVYRIRFDALEEYEERF